MPALPSKRDHQRRGESHGFRVQARPLLGGLLGILMLIFVLSNSETTQVKFLRLNIAWPMWFILLLTACSGAAIGYIIARRIHRD